MKKIITVLTLSLLPTMLFAKEYTYRLPAQATPTMKYTASCEILKASSKSPKWISVAKKELEIKPSDGKNDADIILNADDLQIEYTSLINQQDIGKGSLWVLAVSFLKVKNLKTSDVLQLSGQDQATYETNRENEMGHVDVNYTIGSIDPRLPNQYMIGCKIFVK